MRKIKLVSSLILFAVLISNTLQAQESESKFDIGVDLQSRYIWRGINLGGPSPSMQPYVSFATDKFEIGAWGAYSISGAQTGQEADLYLLFSPTETFSITVTDYFFPSELVGDNGYFDYNKDITGHVLEGMLSFNGTESFPLTAMLAVNFYGADKNADGDDNYSAYAELGYSKSFSDSELGLFVGGLLNESAYYGTDGAAIINLGVSYSKEIKITDSYSLPVNGALIFNPDAGNMFITFGFSL